MKKALLFLLCALSGCAILRGQMKYTGTGDRPTITEQIVRFPQTPGPGRAMLDNTEKKDYDKHREAMEKKAMGNYWDMPADKLATVFNPLSVTLFTHIECYASFPSSWDFTIPPHTSQDFLFTTNATYMYDTLCRIAYYRVVEEKK